MLMPNRNGGRALAPVRLGDVPIAIRRRYGRMLHDRAAKSGDIQLALDIQRAVEFPSERIYWVLASEAQRVLG